MNAIRNSTDRRIQQDETRRALMREIRSGAGIRNRLPQPPATPFHPEPQTRAPVNGRVPPVPAHHPAPTPAASADERAPALEIPAIPGPVRAQAWLQQVPNVDPR